MNIQVTGRHVEVGDRIREYVGEKVQKLTKFYDRIHAVEVIFDSESDEFKAEMIVRADGGKSFVAQDTGPDTIALIDNVVEKLERQLRKFKEQRRDHKHDGKVEPPL